MSGYRVLFDPRVEKSLRKLDNMQGRLVMRWIGTNLDGCEDPRAIGKPLKGELHGQWRYRIGDIRILARIDDANIVIQVVKIGDRKSIYKER